MNNDSNNRVFLSYAHDDLEKVWRVYNGLVKRKVNVWFDKVNLGPGKWYPQIMKTIPRSRYFVICVSEAALRKIGEKKPGFQDVELNRAYEIAMAQPDSAFTIVPVRLEDCDRGDIRISTFQQYDLFENFEATLDHLAVNLEGMSLADKTTEDTRTEDEKMVESLWGKFHSIFYAGEYEKGFAIIRALEILKPGDGKVLQDKGAALAVLGRHEEALLAYDKSLAINPDNAAVLRNKGITFSILGKHEEALNAYDKTLAANPDDATILNNKGNSLISLGRYKEALEVLNITLVIKPDSTEAWFNKGNALHMLGKHEDALGAYNKALIINPDYAEAWSSKGVMLDKLGRHEESLLAYDKALALNPHYTEAWNNKGNVT